MQITESKSPKEITLFISGKIDSNSSIQLQTEISRALKINKNIVLDMSKVEHVSDEGIYILHMGQKMAFSKRGSVQLINANPLVRVQLQNAGLSRLLAGS